MFKTTLSLSNESLSYLNELGVTQEEITSIDLLKFFLLVPKRKMHGIILRQI